jgi:hypothetical protein
MATRSGNPTCVDERPQQPSAAEVSHSDFQTSQSLFGYLDLQAEKQARHFSCSSRPILASSLLFSVRALDFSTHSEYARSGWFGLHSRFHTGQTGVGSGMPGGMGMRLKYSNPMYLDDVAADFPDLRIILAHPSFPWQEEALSVATHKPNVYIDLSGWSPKYFPPILVRYINSILQDKMLFGSDWPVITPDRWLSDFAKLEIRDEIRPKVLKANARRLLGI